jgi:hypothetical protein
MDHTPTEDYAGTRRAKIITAVWLVFSQILDLIPIVLITIGVTFFGLAFNCSDCIGDTIDNELGTYPTLVLLCFLGSWTLFAYRKYLLASIVSPLPLLLSPIWAGT